MPRNVCHFMLYEVQTHSHSLKSGYKFKHALYLFYGLQSIKFDFYGCIKSTPDLPSEGLMYVCVQNVDRKSVKRWTNEYEKQRETEKTHTHTHFVHIKTSKFQLSEVIAIALRGALKQQN